MRNVALYGSTATALGRDFSLVYYPKASLSWMVSEEDFWNFEWLFEGYPRDSDSAPGLLQVFLGGKPWLAPLALALLAPLMVLRRHKSDPLFARVLLWAGGGGLADAAGDPDVVAVRAAIDVDPGPAPFGTEGGEQQAGRPYLERGVASARGPLGDIP